MANYTVRTARSASSVRASPQKMGSPKDPRWATGRNVKMNVGFGRYEVIEVWTLKERLANGSVRVVASNVGRECAEEFVYSCK